MVVGELYLKFNLEIFHRNLEVEEILENIWVKSHITRMRIESVKLINMDSKKVEGISISVSFTGKN